MKRNECRFCLLPDVDRVIARTKNFVVMLSLGPVVEGYVVIVSREHFSCCAGLPSEQIRELRAVRKAVAEAQLDVYGTSLFFEHGRSGACVPEGHGEDHCFHAHLHVVPTDLPLYEKVGEEYPLTSFETLEDLAVKYESEGAPYIAVQTGRDESVGVAEDPAELPKQYLRTRLAQLTGQPHLGDWQAFPGFALISAGRVRLAGTVLEKLKAADLVEKQESP